MKGLEETLTFDEASEVEAKSFDQLVYYIREIAKEAVDDDDELSDVMVNMMKYVGALRNSCVLKGILMDPGKYLEELGLPDGMKVVIEEVA